MVESNLAGQRIVRFSPEADQDLGEIHTSTAWHDGLEMADAYMQLLVGTAQDAAEGTCVTRAIADRQGQYLVRAQWPGDRDGHHIIFVGIPAGIYVLRVLHTAMNRLT